MHGTRFANVISLLALVVALGGSAYAALRVTGKNVADGSLTGADIKKRSVPVNRLKGKLPAGAAGAAGAAGPKGETGAKGDTGPAGPAGAPDTSQFFTKAESDARFVRPGETIVAMWPHNFLLFNNVNIFKATESASMTATATGMSGFALYPDAPVEIQGKPLKLVGLDACYDASSAGVAMTAIYLFVNRVPRTDTPLATDTPVYATFNPPADGVGCQRLDLPTPFTLTADDTVRASTQVNWTATGGAGSLGLGRWAFVFASS
ncbi:MAG: hypothetical protein ACJ762_08045 [Solirubrobacteraceae bacterium]